METKVVGSIRALRQDINGEICFRKKYLENVSVPTGEYERHGGNGDGSIIVEYIVLNLDDPCLRCNGKDTQCKGYEV